MTITIDLPPDTEARLQRRAERAGEDPRVCAANVLQSVLANDSAVGIQGEPTAYGIAMAKLLNRTPEERAATAQRMRALIVPGRPLPPGKTLEDVLVGQWPGVETDAQIEAALAELS